MREIAVQKLTHEAFAPFGTFYNIAQPSGYALKGELHQFFPDRVTGSSNTRLGFSPILVNKPEEMIIDAVEYHTTTWEMVMPLNDDCIIHVAPASAGVPLPEHTQAFRIPQGTLAKVKTGIWHLAPLPVKVEQLQAMIILPECTYANDCTVVELKKEEQFKLVL